MAQHLRKASKGVYILLGSREALAFKGFGGSGASGVEYVSILALQVVPNYTVGVTKYLL